MADVNDIKSIVDDIRGKFGQGSCFFLDQDPTIISSDTTERASTGLYELDWASSGGFVKGVMHEIHGNEGEGKTTLALTVMKEFIKNNMTVFYCDAEHSLNLDYARRIGVDTSKIIISQPDFGEQGLDIVQAACEGGVNVVVIDSVTALVPKAEIDGDFTDVNMGAHARLMSKMCRVLTPIIGRNKVILILINQIRNKIGVFFGSPEVTTGGKGIKFYSGMRMRVSSSFMKKGDQKDMEKKIMRVDFIKQKWGVPYRDVELLLNIGEGINIGYDRLAYGLRMGFVSQASSYFKLGKLGLGNGKIAAAEFLMKNEEAIKLYESLRQETMHR